MKGWNFQQCFGKTAVVRPHIRARLVHTKKTWQRLLGDQARQRLGSGRDTVIVQGPRFSNIGAPPGTFQKA